MPSGMSRNKSVAGLQCPDSRKYINEHVIPVILRFEAKKKLKKDKTEIPSIG
jgi:hypothetical protein